MYNVNLWVVVNIFTAIEPQMRYIFEFKARVQLVPCKTRVDLVSQFYILAAVAAPGMAPMNR